MDDGFTMRRMTRAELDTAAEWAAAEGWNPGLGDATAFWATDPEGFFVGELDGEVVASISIVRYVAPNPTLASAPHGPALHGSAAPEGLEPFARTDLADLVVYDASVFGCRRPEFLEAWLAQAGSRTLVAREAGRITGYGAIRPAAEGYRVNPLFAETTGIAASLLDALLAAVPEGELVAVDVPGVNDDAVRLVAERSMTPAFETARMYAGDVPDTDWRRVFGVTSFELG